MTPIITTRDNIPHATITQLAMLPPTETKLAAQLLGPGLPADEVAATMLDRDFAVHLAHIFGRLHENQFYTDVLWTPEGDAKVLAVLCHINPANFYSVTKDLQRQLGKVKRPTIAHAVAEIEYLKLSNTPV
jgi:hypothetical protein